MKRLLYTILILLPIVSVSSQTTDLKETFLEAESYYLFEEYNEALPLYLKIHRADPENDNINYKIGVCFLNDPYQKDKSIRYLEDASKNINPNFKENNFKEKTAPPEAFFYLGNAYLVNNNIDEALKNYKHFRQILDEKIYDVELVEEQINICNTAKNLMKIPVDFDKEVLSANVNSQFTDMNPIMSGDGKRLVWVSKRRFYDATMFSEKVDGDWQPPRMILPELGVDRDVYPTCLNYDGTIMIIYRSDDFIGNLYQSELVDGQWSNMQKIGDNINTKYWESHGSMTKDGNTLYFTSNRKGGFGGLDIYKSEKQENGSWGEPENLGETVNTRYNEETPFITENEDILYFSSYGHFNMGGYDVFYSRKNEAGQWDVPINMGYPINTTDDDLFFFPVDNGNNAYFSMYTEDEGQGLHDLYFLDVYSDYNPRMYMVTGFLSADDENLTENDNVEVFLLDRLSGDTIDSALPDFEFRKFSVRAPQGKYNLLVKSDTYKDAITPLDITKESNKEGIQLENQVALETKPYVPQVLTGEDSKIEAEETTYNVNSGEPVKVKLKLEKDTKLIANVYVDSILTASDTFMIEKKRFTYEMTPEPGLNTIELTLVEENGDQSKRTIQVYAVKQDEVEPEIQIIEPEIIEPEIIEEELPALTEQDSVNRAAQQLNDRLSKYADGNLKAVLDTLDVSKLELNSTNELITYLKSHAEENGYTGEDIDRAIASAVSGGDVEILHELMLKNAEGSLKEYLENLDPAAEGLTTPEQYMQHLRKVAETEDFSNDDIDRSLAKTMDQVNNDAELMRLEMMKEADSPLKELLETLDLKALDIESREELMAYLHKNSDATGLDARELEIQRAISENDRDAESFKSLLLQNTSGSLYNYLMNLDLEAEGITTSEELIAHLQEVADAEDFSIDDVHNAISFLNSEISPVEETKDLFLNSADGELKSYLEQLNLGKTGLYTPEMLIKHLMEKAGTEFTNEEFLNMLTDLLEDTETDVESLLEYLIKNAPSSQRDFLKDIDLESLGITTVEELIAYLLQHSDELGMNKEGLSKTLIELMGDLYLEKHAPGFEIEDNSSSSGLAIGGGLLLLGLGAIIFFIFWKRRRKDEEQVA